MSILNDILRNAVAAKASDIHINVGLPPLFRIHTVVTKSDFPIVQGVVFMLSLIYIGLALLADLMNAVLDPRLRAE